MCPKKSSENAEDSNANNLVGFELRHLLSIIGQPRYPSGRLSASVFVVTTSPKKFLLQTLQAKCIHVLYGLG